jgi:uncharacterized protein (DUF1330 family)
MMPCVRVALIALSFAFNAAAHAQSPAPTAPQATSKPGYMLVIGTGVDPKRMGAYASAAVPLLLKYQGKLMFATEEGQTEVLEGGPFPGSVRVFEFPSLKSAKEFYYSKEYQAAIPLRAGNGKIDVIVSDAFVPDPKWFQPK